MWQVRRHAIRGCRRMSDAASASPSVSPLHLFLLLPLLALVPLQAGRAQDATTVATGSIRGVVQDQATGAPLPSAQVMVVGTKLRAEAGPDGRYTITGVAPGTYRVQTQRIGYGVSEAIVVVTGEWQTATADFRLQQLAVALQEVVVVGYGTQVRRDVTGSLASVGGAEVHEVPKVNAIEALKGRVPGVDIVTTGNKPGDGVRVRLRGERSLKASNDPLYVLDGIPMAGGIGDLNPRDIESVEVLKDASATAIYGSRGANGVVLLTTRKGRAGTTNLTYDSYGGYQAPVRRVRVFTGPEFAEYRRESERARPIPQYLCDTVCAAEDAKLFGPDGTLPALQAGRWTDWQDLVLREGAQVSNEIGITGGDERTSFALSAGQLQQQGIVRAQDFTRRSMRLNFDHELNPRLRVGSSTSLIRTAQNLGRGDPVYSEALTNNPLGMAFDSTGAIIFKPTPDGQRVNPLSDIHNWTDERVRTRLFGTLFASYDLSDALTWRVNFGADLTFSRRGQFRGAQTQAMQGSPPDGAMWDTRTQAYTLDNILTYRRSLGAAHRVDATALYSVQQERTERDSMQVTGLPYEHQKFFDLGSGLKPDWLGSGLTAWALQSFMARVNYTFKDRYLLTVSSRLDGSSRLAPGQKYGMFPSVALAWRLSEEDFIRRTGVFSDLKLRASFGRSGNTAIDPYQTEGALRRTMYSFTDQPAVGYGPGRLPNPNLKWEKTSQLDVGLEFTAVHNRLSGSVDYYSAYTTDLIMDRQLPPTTGYSSILQNVGATRNSGVEVALSALVAQDWHGLRWNTDFNVATNRNSIVSLYGGKKDDVGNGWFIGQPISVFYDYQFGGIWQTQDSISGAAQRYARKPGQIRIVDQNGDGKIDDKDRIILGSSFPRWTGSLTTRLDWNGIDLSVMAVARLGFMVHDELYTSQSTLAGRYNNVSVNYWTPTNPSNMEPRPNAAQENPDYGGARGYEEGSFLRVRTMTLGYTIPGDHLGWMRARSLRIYATALDPFLFTKFRGLDPESRPDAGVPSYRTLMMGITLGI
jgi:TonB-linked SusC/RagA family outer membrane protein